MRRQRWSVGLPHRRYQQSTALRITVALRSSMLASQLMLLFSSFLGVGLPICCYFFNLRVFIQD